MLKLTNQVVEKITNAQVYTYPSADVVTSGSITSATAKIFPNWTIVVTITTVNNGTTVTLDTPFAFKLTDVLVLMTSGGNGGGSLTVKNNTDAITDAIDLGDGDKDLQRAGTIDDEFDTFAKDADDLVLTFAATEGSTPSTFSCRVVIFVTPN